jgi:hypothetical protein
MSTRKNQHLTLSVEPKTDQDLITLITAIEAQSGRSRIRSRFMDSLARVFLMRAVVDGEVTKAVNLDLLADPREADQEIERIMRLPRPKKRRP